MRYWPTIAAGLLLTAAILSLVGHGRTIIGIAQCVYALALVALLFRSLTQPRIDQTCSGGGSGVVGGGGTSSGTGGKSG